MKNLCILFLITFSFCKEKNPESICPNPNKFSYDGQSGTCKNCEGAIGYNQINLEQIRKSKDAECISISKIELLLLLGDSVEIPTRFGYEKLTNYNFKGSILDSCELFFNHIIDADLRGTNLSTLQYGYAFVTGKKDNFTKPPITGKVEINGDSINCFQ